MEQALIEVIGRQKHLAIRSFRASTKSTRLPHNKVAGLDRGQRAVYTSGAKR